LHGFILKTLHKCIKYTIQNTIYYIVIIYHYTLHPYRLQQGTDLYATGFSDAMYPPVEADHSPRDTWGVRVLTGDNSSRRGYLSRGTPCSCCTPRRKKYRGAQPIVSDQVDCATGILHCIPPLNHLTKLGASQCTNEMDRGYQYKKQSSCTRATFRPVGQSFITSQIPSTARSRLA